jgi:hypothetical protein
VALTRLLSISAITNDYLVSALEKASARTIRTADDWREAVDEAAPGSGTDWSREHSNHISRRHTVVAARGTMMWIGRIVSTLISLLFAFSAGMKLKGGAEVVQGMAHLGLPESLMMPLGILEISCVAIYVIPATSVLGAILLTGYIGGAILAHLRIGEPILMQIALGGCVWLGLYLRENRLKQLIPVRTRAAIGTME